MYKYKRFISRIIHNEDIHYKFCLTDDDDDDIKYIPYYIAAVFSRCSYYRFSANQITKLCSRYGEYI